MAAEAGARVILTSPVNRFGSGMIMVPSLPVTSTYPIRVSGESKLNTLWLTPPSTNRRDRRHVGGHLHVEGGPARSPAWIVRVARLGEPTAATLCTDPNRWTRAVR